ncbi:MAG: UMP kinase, partial [Gammaproteobacteria bacterium]
MSAAPAYRRIMLKLSGEALAGERTFGIDPGSLKSIARAVRGLHEIGGQVAMVIGAGNMFRGVDLMKA